MNRQGDAANQEPTVLITGASSGIGLETARLLSQEGFRVIAGYRRPEAARMLSQTLGPSAVPLRLDVTDESSIRRAAQQVASIATAGVAGLVNNAGIALAGPLEGLSTSQLTNQFHTNVLGPIRVSQALLPLIRRGNGRIVHVGSAAGSLALPFLGTYAASKSALDLIADSMRRELQLANLSKKESLPRSSLGQIGRFFGFRPARSTPSDGDSQTIPVIMVRPGRMATGIFDRSEREAIAGLESMEASIQQRYRPYLLRLQTLLHRYEKHRGNPLRVAKVIHRALTVKRPRSRYQIGLDAVVVHQLTKWLPDSILDALIARALRPR